jgi:hypothetical protein
VQGRFGALATTSHGGLTATGLSLAADVGEAQWRAPPASAQEGGQAG